MNIIYFSPPQADKRLGGDSKINAIYELINVQMQN